MANPKTRLTKTSLNYIKDFKELNNLGTNSDSLDLIIKEHKKLKNYINKLKIIHLHSLIK